MNERQTRGPRWSARIGRALAYGILAVGVMALIASIAAFGYVTTWALNGIAGLW